MTRQPHDQFAKQYLAELLAPLGEVQISREVTDETRQIDVWFESAPQPTAERERLGLLGQMASSTCLLEPFRNQPSKTEIRNCLLKLFSLHGELQRRARREDESLPEAELPRLWILSTSASAALLDSFGAKLDSNNWPQGVYFLAEALKTSVVAINQLPPTPETLWLRILGKGATQQQAITELIALGQDNPLRRSVLELLFTWRINLETKENLTEDERELIMQLSPAYLQWREETLLEGRQEGIQLGRQEGIQLGRQEGRQEGKQEGKQEGRLEERRFVIENLLRSRFGTIDDQLSGVIQPILELPPQEYVGLLLQVFHLSREELLARFGRSAN